MVGAGRLGPLGRIEESEWRRLLESYPRANVRPGASLVEQGEFPYRVHYLEAGLVKLCHVTQDGEGSILGLRYPGTWVGSSAAILGSRLVASAVTVTPCRVVTLRSTILRRLVRSRRSWSWAMHRTHALELRSELEQLALGSLAARARLEELLGLLWREHHAAVGEVDGSLTLPLKDYEFAQLLGVTRQYLSRLLHELEQAGRLRHEGRRWVLSGRVRDSVL